MAKTIKTSYTDQEFRQIIREELKAVLSGTDQQLTGQSDNDPISIKQASEFIKLKPSTIYNLISKNKIPFHKKPGSSRVLFSKSELTEWLKKDEK